ncbi:MAG TPA: hypothetical protein VKX49_12955 [Bryobacteraceae bacterium]|nr:hypothetical protein [Bryobacteraceae bacterium]
MKAEAQAFEIKTEQISLHELGALVPQIAGLLRSWGYDTLSVTFGYGCNAPTEQLWQPQEVETEQVPAFVQHGVRTGILLLGGCDLHIEDRERTLEFRLCHESDAHFECVQQDRVQEVERRWLKQGLVLYISTGPKGSALPKEWKRIDPGAS